MARTERLGASLVRHGPPGNRVYLMKLDPEDMPEIVDQVEELAATNDYGKVFARVPESLAGEFADAGYEAEARVPDFFPTHEDCLFMSQFRNPERKHEDRRGEYEAVLAAALARDGGGTLEPLGPELAVRVCEEDEAEVLAAFYGEAFASYPFPIVNPDYIRRTMRSHITYCGIWLGDAPVALSSAEADAESRSVEMTDFAVRPDHRGKAFARRLLVFMEGLVRRRGFKTALTIARAASWGMNLSFARQGYDWGGRLKNNTHISGRIESMNVWYRPLEQSAG